MGVGTDSAPIRLIVLQLLHVLSRRLKVTTDGYGLKPGLDGYLNRMPPPKMEFFIGKPRNPDIAIAADKNSGPEPRKDNASGVAALLELARRLLNQLKIIQQDRQVDLKPVLRSRSHRHRKVHCKVQSRYQTCLSV